MKHIFPFLFLTILSTQAQTPRASETRGTVTIARKELKYKATVQEIFLPINGDPVGSIITTTYETEHEDPSNRPVLFLFNGGPGASSSPLHMYAFGPVRLKKAQDSTIQINNEHTLLNVADLVFIDPVGTGFTQVLNEEKARAYWDVEGDARSVIEVIKLWKEKRNRNTSPTFICGESYGTVRAAKIMAIAENFPVKGVLLFSPVLDFSLLAPVSGNEMPYLMELPTMAAVAWYHKKLDSKIKSEQQAFNEAIAFAKGDYINALFQGNTLTVTQRDKVAARLSELTGLSIKEITNRNLRVNSDDFEMLLLADKNMRIGKLNGQISAPLPKEAKPYSSREDPSLIVNVIMKGDYVGKYFNRNLQFPGTGVYRGVNFDANGKWKWASMDAYLGYYSVLPGLEAAVKKDPKLKILVAGGVYDLATPLYSTKYLFDHSSIPIERTIFLTFPTGHSIFDKEMELAKFADHVRNFVAK